MGGPGISRYELKDGIKLRTSFPEAYATAGFDKKALTGISETDSDVVVCLPRARPRTCPTIIIIAAVSRRLTTVSPHPHAQYTRA